MTAAEKIKAGLDWKSKKQNRVMLRRWVLVPAAVPEVAACDVVLTVTQ